MTLALQKCEGQFHLLEPCYISRGVVGPRQLYKQYQGHLGEMH